MARTVNPSTLRKQLKNLPDAEDKFSVLRDIAILCNAAGEDPQLSWEARDCVIRALEHREALNGYGELLDGLVRAVGLYPYLAPEELSLPEALAYEAHRPVSMPGEDVVFHSVQADIYRRLLAGKSVIVSAPTSFGKSLITDALIASGQYANVVIVVPTIALIDETRRRLSRFRDRYKIITHVGQELAKRNLFVLTQERVIDHPELPALDLFVIDEFYKLDARRGDSERSNLLNEAFYKLWKLGRQFYFLGPNIEALTGQLPESFEFEFISTNFSTVAFDVTRVMGEKDERLALVNLCRQMNSPTLIYCRSPKRTRDVASWLMSAGGANNSQGVNEAVEWISKQYHPEWLVAKALQLGIGIHHGRLPRFLSQYIVRAFNEGDLNFLVCTSTLIEGVNTRAKNVVIFDKTIAKRKYDFFTFNNIRGRSGRMFHHFVGHVYLFHDAPIEELPEVDVPVLTQPDTAPASLLMQLAPEELSDRSMERLEPVFSQSDLPLELLRANHGVDPARQVELARTIRGDRGIQRSLMWTGFPRYENLKATCEILWEHLLEPGARRPGVLSASQLTFRIDQLRRNHQPAALIREELSSGHTEDADEAVEHVLDFLRTWAGFAFPRLLMALDRIQKHVLASLGLRPGDYSFFATQVENLFLPVPLAALDEYGIPVQVSERLERYLRPDGDLDHVLERLRKLDAGSLPLSPFERRLVRDAQAAL